MPKTMTSGARPEDYRHIEAWGRYLTSKAWFIRDEQERAVTDLAALDAIYRDCDGVWHRYSDVDNPVTRRKMDALLAANNAHRTVRRDLVEKEFKNLIRQAARELGEEAQLHIGALCDAADDDSMFCRWLDELKDYEHER